MNYLHGSDIKIHGRLSSSACVVDGRFLLKLRCYGPKCFYEAESKKKSKKETLNYNSKTNLQGPSFCCFIILLKMKKNCSNASPFLFTFHFPFSFIRFSSPEPKAQAKFVRCLSRLSSLSLALSLS